MKKLGWLFAILSVLLSDVMCAVTAYNWCEMVWGGRYLGYSAPPEVSLLTAVPFLIGIALCAVLSAVFFKKAKKNS